MVAPKFVHLIERHSDALATTLHARLEQSELTRSYTSRIPPEEVTARESEIYQNLGDWLLTKTESDVASRYREIGARRYRQQVPLPELVWAILLAKRTMWDFLDSEAFPDGLPEVYGELDLVHMVGRFFDRAVYYAVEGYEEARAQEPIAKAQKAVVRSDGLKMGSR
jgi:hypothetical protein